MDAVEVAVYVEAWHKDPNCLRTAPGYCAKWVIKATPTARDNSEAACAHRKRRTLIVF